MLCLRIEWGKYEYPALERKGHEMALTCSNCGKELPDDAKFCSECGTTVIVQEKKPNYCANCFAELPEKAKFCLQCGKPAIIAQPDFPRPELDKALYEELQTSSPPRVITVEDEIEDFEKNKAELTIRAR